MMLKEEQHWSLGIVKHLCHLLAAFATREWDPPCTIFALA